MDFKTLCARSRPHGEPPGRPLSPPIVTSATFSFDSLAEIDEYYETGRGYLYSRYENPTVRSAEKLLAELEGGDDAVLFGSGMAAISTVFLTLARAGERVAAQRELYGGTADLLKRVLPDLGIDTKWLDLEELSDLTPGKLDGCRLLYLETPTNPTLRIVDLARVAHVAREAGVPVAVDSTFGTPALQRPLSLGCQVVIHSCTKYLGGHSDLLGGAAVAAGDLIRRIAQRRRALGGILGPVTAFLLYRGMRTLAVRMEAHQRGATAVAEALRQHPKVRRIYWPGLPDSSDHELARKQMNGFGGMVTFEVKGGFEEARRVHDRLRLFCRAGSLGGVESLASLPVTMSHRYMSDAERARVGVTPEMIRLSVGLESAEDLIEDLMQALG